MLFLFPMLLVMLIKRAFISLRITRVIVWYFSTVYVRIKDLEYVISFGVEYFIAKIEVEVEPLVENESNKSYHSYINIYIYIYLIDLRDDSVIKLAYIYYLFSYLCVRIYTGKRGNN